MTPGDSILNTLTTSRPVTEKKRRPTAERRSMYVASMKAPLVPSASFDENDPSRLSLVKEGLHNNIFFPLFLCLYLFLYLCFL